MNRLLTSISIVFLRIKVFLRGQHLKKKYAVEEMPLRSELFSGSQMKQHGKQLASLHKITDKRSSQLLLTRLTENEIILIETHSLLSSAVRAQRLITPAGEWLRDNV